jgi:SAM-dependent methyltransferase
MADGNHVWKLLGEPASHEQDGYFDYARMDLVNMLHAPLTRFVDVGCGSGVTAAEVKRRFPEATVEGFEFSPAAAKIAATRIDAVHVGNVEEVDFGSIFAPASIDGLLLADVLEHLYNPWKLLEKLRPYLALDAQIIASIPNVRNLVLLSEIATGSFRYEAAGLLDVTHIRFFTLSDMHGMFDATGYDVVSVARVKDPRIRPIEVPSFPTGLDLPGITIKVEDAKMLDELQSIQFYLSLRRRA